MNERIRDIKDKLWSEEYWNNPNTDKLLSAQLNRFAELIVRECVNLCYDRAYRGTFGSFTDGAMLCANEIKEHFGVEE